METQRVYALHCRQRDLEVSTKNIRFLAINRAKPFGFFNEDSVPGSTASCCWPYFCPPNLAPQHNYLIISRATIKLPKPSILDLFFLTSLIVCSVLHRQWALEVSTKTIGFLTIIRAKTFDFVNEDFVPGSTASCCWPYFCPQRATATKTPFVFVMIIIWSKHRQKQLINSLILV